MVFRKKKKSSNQPTSLRSCHSTPFCGNKKPAPFKHNMLRTPLLLQCWQFRLFKYLAILNASKSVLSGGLCCLTSFNSKHSRKKHDILQVKITVGKECTHFCMLVFGTGSWQPTKSDSTFFVTRNEFRIFKIFFHGELI